MRIFSDQEIYRRLENFVERLNRLRIDIAIIHHNADLFYFTGTVQDGYLVMSATGETALAVRRNLSRALEQTPLRPIIPLRNIRDIYGISREVFKNNPKRVGFSMDVLSSANYLFFRENIFPDSEFIDISMAIRLQRSIKSKEEIVVMKDAAKISHAVYSAVPSLLVEGKDEWDLCVDLESVARKSGHLGFIRIRNPRLEMYFGHILSGPEAAVPSYGDTPTGGMGLSPSFAQGSTRRKIRKNDLVSVDTMICHHGYLNDQTRNFSLGTPPDELIKAYELSVRLHKFFRKRACKGTVAGEIYDEMIEIVNRTGFAPYFMGPEDNRVFFVGHGLGIEVDEFPFIARNQKTVLDSGMTVAFEPKFVIPGKGVAGLENTYLITEKGAEAINISPEELVLI